MLALRGARSTFGALPGGLPGGGLARFFFLAMRVMDPICLVAPLGDAIR